MAESVHHPVHYGGDVPYETIKVIRAWGLGFSLGNAVKYISRASKKGATVEDLKKAMWYLNEEITWVSDKGGEPNQIEIQNIPEMYSLELVKHAWELPVNLHRAIQSVFIAVTRATPNYREQLENAIGFVGVEIEQIIKRISQETYAS